MIIIVILLVLGLILGLISATLDIGFWLSLCVFLGLLVGAAVATGIVAALPLKMKKFMFKLQWPLTIGGGAIALIFFIVTMATSKTSHKVELIGGKLYEFTDVYYSETIWAIIGLFLLFFGLLLVMFEDIIMDSSSAPAEKSAPITIPEGTEQSSILHFFNKVNSETTSADLDTLLEGAPKKYHDTVINYETSEYTLNNVQSNFIHSNFTACGAGGQIKAVAWIYEGKDEKTLFYQSLEYISGILGEPKRKSCDRDIFGETLTADWEGGYHLECNPGINLQFRRKFR